MILVRGRKYSTMSGSKVKSTTLLRVIKNVISASYKHIHMSHTPPTPLTSTSPVLDKIPEPRVPLIHALIATTPHTLTAHTHATQTTPLTN